MTNDLTPEPEHRAGTPTAWQKFTANLGARAKKAWSAGVAGAVLAGSGVSLSAFWAEGNLDTEAVATAAGAIVVGFVGGFLAAFIPRNDPPKA
jgi:uncharacterized membrane protein YfcA